MSERSGQTAKGKDGKTKYASLNLFETYKGKSLEAQKPVVPPRHGLQSLGKVASARRMPPPANLPSLKAENKGNNPNVSLVPKDGTGWASKQDPADPKSIDVLSAPQPESLQPVVSQTPAEPTRPRTPPAPEAPAPASALAAGARSWAQANVTHGAQGDGGKGSNQQSPFSREEFPTLQAAGDQDRVGREQGTADQWYGPGPSLRPQNVTSWRDGGGRALAPVLAGEGVAEGGAGGALVMEEAAVGGVGQAPPPLQHQQNPSSHGPPRNPPAGSPSLPLPQPAVGPGFPAYRGIMPPFMYPPYLPFPPPYGPQGPYRFPPPGEVAPRFSRSQGGPDGRPQGGPRGGGGEVVKRPSILKQDDLKELDELDHDGDEGWAGAHEEIDYSAKLKFSDDEGEEEGDEGERSESKNGTREQRSQDGPPPVSCSRASDSGGDSRRTPPSNVGASPPPPSSKPGWAEEGGNGWGGQGGAPVLYQGRRLGLGGPREQPSPPLGPLLGQGPYSYYRQDRPHNQAGSVAGSVPASLPPGKPATPQQQALPQAGGPTPPPQAGLLAPPQGEDEDETWRQRRKQSSSEISAAVERARRRREEEERRMEDERRAACAEKLKRLDEKQQQLGGGSKPPSLDGSSTAATAGSPSPSLSASASSPNISQPPSPCVDPEEPPLLSVQPGAGPGGDRQRANSNSSYDSNTDTQACTLPPAPPPQQPLPQLEAPVGGEAKEEALGGSHPRGAGGPGGGGVVDPVKVESVGGGGAGRQASGLPAQGYSKYQKSLPPRFQRQQQEQLLKQWQQQQQHSQASQQGQLAPQPPAPQGPSPGPTPQPGPKQTPIYQPGSLGRPSPLPMNFDPRWMMMPYMDPRMMQGRPPPMDYYPPNMHPSGMMGRERSDSGGSGSDPFDRQQQHPGHPHRGTPPMDPKLAWGAEVFPGAAEGRGLSSPLRQKQGQEDEDLNKGPRSDTPPVRMREGGPGPIQQPSSATASSNQTPPPVGSQGSGQGGSHHPHPHQPFMGGRGNYSNFPDSSARGPPHQQQRGSGGVFNHQDEGQPRGGQQGQIWGTPHPHYDRNGRADLSPLESNSHLHHHHGHHPHNPSHFSLHPHKPESGRERDGDAPKKGNPSPPLLQPSLSSSCSSSSSSSSSAREDGSGKAVLHHLPPSRENEASSVHSGSAGSAKQDKMGSGHSHSSSSQSSAPSPSQHSGHPQPQQQGPQQHHHHPKPREGQRGREHKTETQWGPRPGSSNPPAASSHNRRANTAMGGNARGEDSANPSFDHKPSSQSGGSNANKRAGPIKRPVLKEMKREGGESEGGEKTSGSSSGKDKEQEGNQASSAKQEASSGPQSSAPSGKDEPAQSAKPRNGGKDRSAVGGPGRGPKDGDNPAPSSGYSGPSSRRERDRSFERGGAASYSARGSRASRGRGGEFYGRGRGYRGTYTASTGGGGSSSSRGRGNGRSSRDYRPTAGTGYHQEFKGEASAGRHGQERSQPNPARARNRSETRSEGSEYEEIPKRRRQRGSETGSESAASDLAQSDKEDRKPSTKNASDSGPSGSGSSGPARGSQARVFTPRGVPSRRGRGGGGGGGGGGGIYRSGGGGGGMPGGHRSGPGSTSQGWSSKSSASVRKQQAPPQSSVPKELGRGSNGEKKEKAADGSQGHTQGTNPPQPQSTLAATAPAPQGSTENGGLGTQQSAANSTSNTSGPLPLPLSGSEGRGFPPRGFERPPRRRRHGRSQHQQDKPPRFRRLKERENAARINGGVGVIGGGRPSSPSQNSVQDTDCAPNTASTTGNAPNANHTAATTTNNSGGGHLGSANVNVNSHHHHHYNQGNAGHSQSQHHHNHNTVGGAKSPDFSNQNSDQANEEWETASESSDFTEFREREGGGGKSYPSHHHHPTSRGGGGGGGGEREMTAKESAANKRSFSSQRPGMERQNRRMNTGGGGGGGGGGGRGPRGPPGGGGGGAGNGGGNRGERRGNWPSPKNRK